MKLASRIQRAETRVWGESFNPTRVIEMAERGEYDLLTGAELNWLMGGMRQALTPETNAALETLFDSFSTPDLRAIMESRELSPEGKRIRERIYKILGATA